MEFFGFKNCMDYLLGCGIVTEVFISDRHSQIASHMKNAMSNITHYFGIIKRVGSISLSVEYFKPCTCSFTELQ